MSGLSVVTHVASHHFSAVDYNEQNWGGALRYDVSESWSIQAGGYRNSYRKWSWYGLADWMPIHRGAFSAGGFAGLVNGYPIRKGRIVPAAGAVAQYRIERFDLRARLMPPTKKSCAVVAFEIGLRL